MLTNNDFLHKPVISLFDGTSLGTSSGLVFGKKLKKLEYLLFTTNGKIPADCAVRTRDILSVSPDAVTIKYSDLAVNTLSSPASLTGNDPEGKDVYTVHGVLCGKVKEIRIEENTYLVTALATDRGENIDLDLIATIGTDMLILQDKERPVTLAKPASRKIKPAKVAQPTASTQNVQLPDRAMINFEFLIGRKVTQDILLEGGRVLVKCGTYITANVLSTVRTHGKLLELTRFSRLFP